MIRWITGSIGTAPAFDSEIMSDYSVVDVRSLVDKFGNSVAATKQKIDEGVNLLEQGKRVVICCDYGISRSNAIATGVLARYKNISFNQAVRTVIDSIGKIEMKLEPLNIVRAAIGDTSKISVDPARILLTGSSGFIGQQILTSLRDHFFVLAPDKNQTDLLSNAISLDLLVKENGINLILHFANPHIYTSNQAMGHTLIMLRNVLDVCRTNDIELIYPSSFEIYSGYKASSIFVNENTTALPKGPYGDTKLLCESLIVHHRNNFGLKASIVRSSTLYSERSIRPKFIRNFAQKAKSNEKIVSHIYLNGEPRLDLMHISDFVSLISKMVATSYSGDLNLGTGELVGTSEIANFIITYLQSKSKTELQNIDDFCANVAMDSSEAKNRLGWRSQIKWQDGLRSYLSMFEREESQIDKQ